MIRLYGKLFIYYPYFFVLPYPPLTYPLAYPVLPDPAPSLALVIIISFYSHHHFSTRPPLTYPLAYPALPSSGRSNDNSGVEGTGYLHYK